MDISLSLKKHIKIHLKNPQNNYILSENCKHCKHDRRISYGTNFKTPKSLKTQTITPINYNNIYRPSFNEITYPVASDYESESSETIYGFPDEDIESFLNNSNNMSLETVNNNSILSIYVREGDNIERCPICYDELKTFQIVRTIVCNHQFHYDCVDKWFYQNRTCPMCRYELLL